MLEKKKLIALCLIIAAFFVAIYAILSSFTTEGVPMAPRKFANNPEPLPRDVAILTVVK